MFLPPIGGLTVYVFGEPSKMSDPSARLALRVHDVRLTSYHLNLNHAKLSRCFHLTVTTKVSEKDALSFSTMTE